MRELARLFAGGKETSAQLGGEQRDVREELDRLPLDELSRLQEGEDRFYVAAVVEMDGARLKVATVEWKKEAFPEWWNRVRPQLRGAVAGQGYGYFLAKIEPALNSCSNDTWTPTPAPPDPRESHTAVWTGSEMIVWGGSPTTDTGGRYDPATDSWTPTSTLNAPTARQFHTAVWTGTEMIVWGGGGVNSPPFNTGGRYDPATDSWQPSSTLNAPSARQFHSAVWTGHEMIVWAGIRTNTGGRYDPATDSWRPTSMLNAPSARQFHSAVWTGTEMIVWGGSTDQYRRAL